MRRSALSIPLFLLSCTSSDGFTIPQHSSAFETGSSVDRQRRSHRPLHIGNDRRERKQHRHRLSALKKKSKEEHAPAPTLTSSERIQEMAAFLAVQLLEVAMKELAKGEEESKMTPEDVEKLAEALQGRLVETKQAQDKLETTWNAAGDAVEELLGDEGVTRLESPTSSKKVEPTKSAAASAAVEKSAQDDKQTGENDSEVTSALATPEMKPPVPPARAPKQSKESDDLEMAATEEQVEKIDATISSSSEAKPLKPPDGVRIPDVVSSEFGRPLEVVASNVNPLRQTPKRVAEAIKKTDNKDVFVSSDKAEEELKPLNDDNDVVPRQESRKEIESKDSESESFERTLERKRSQELFQRKLLEARFKLESKKESRTIATPRSDEATSSSDGDSTLALPYIKLSSAKESKDEEEPSSSVDRASNITTTKSKGESVESIRKFLSQPPTKPSQLSISKISESRLKAIIEARRQPKPRDEEALMAEKYSKMSVEDRAFAILFDLGMIDENKDPLDPSYDHSDDDEICEQLHFPS